MLKRITRIHLAVAKKNKNATARGHKSRKELADELRYRRFRWGTEDTRRTHRTIYGPLLPLE